MGNIVQFEPAAVKRKPVSPPMFKIEAVWVPTELMHKGLSDLALKDVFVNMGQEGYTDAELLLKAIIEASAPEKGTLA